MKLSVRLFDRDESAYLAKVLELASRRARVPVTQSSAAQADVIFLCANEPGAHALLNARDQQRIVVVYGGNPDSHRWTLPRPATSQNLIPLLDDLYRLFGQSDSCNLADNESGSSRLFPSRHGNHLLERLLDLNAAGQPWQCRLTDEIHFIVDPASRQVWAPGEQLAQDGPMALLAVRHANPQLTRLEPGQLPALCQGLDSMSLERFCWQLAIKAEPLPPANHPLLTQRLRLKRWPSFSQLPHTRAQIALTGRLMRQGTSLGEVLSEGTINTEEAVQFFNCASACGLIQLEGSSPAPSAPVEAPRAEIPPEPGRARQQRTLFGRILRSLTGLHQTSAA